MHNQRQDQDHRDHPNLALRAITIEHPTQPKQRSWQGRAGQKGNPILDNNGHAKPDEIHNKPRPNGQGQRIARQRAPHGKGQDMRGHVARLDPLHCGYAHQITKRGMQRDNRKIPCKAIGAISALHDRQAQQHGIGEHGHKPNRHRICPNPPKDDARPEHAQKEHKD